jgi:hypothetical protein
MHHPCISLLISSLIYWIIIMTFIRISNLIGLVLWYLTPLSTIFLNKRCYYIDKKILCIKGSFMNWYEILTLDICLDQYFIVIFNSKNSAKIWIPFLKWKEINPFLYFIFSLKIICGRWRVYRWRHHCVTLRGHLRLACLTWIVRRTILK